MDTAALGNRLRRVDPEFAPQSYGYEKLLPLLAEFQDIIEIKIERGRNPLARARPDTSPILNPPPTQSAVSKAAPVRQFHARRPLGGALQDWAYIPDVAATLLALRDLALDERWSFGPVDEPETDFPILWNYLRFTFVRLQNERKICESVVDHTEFAAFNTGLVDKRYEPIFAVFRHNSIPNRQQWRTAGFCIAGEGWEGKNLVRNFNPLPQPPHYFSRVEDMIYDVTAGEPEVDWEHVIIEDIERLPIAFLIDHAPKEFELLDLLILPRWERTKYFKNLGSAIREDLRTYRAIKNRLADAVDLAVKRTRWNFKTAIPQYYPRGNTITLLLPLALVNEDIVDLALVVEKTRSGNYLGHTIFPLDWAYVNARLVCRPYSDWLLPSAVPTDAVSIDFEDDGDDETSA